jgi:hypothetical protein
MPHLPGSHARGCRAYDIDATCSRLDALCFDRDGHHSFVGRPVVGSDEALDTCFEEAQRRKSGGREFNVQISFLPPRQRLALAGEIEHSASFFFWNVALVLALPNPLGTTRFAIISKFSRG